MISLTLEDDRLLLERDSESPKSLTLRLTALRKVFLFMPREYDWYCAETTADHNATNLEALTAQEYADLLDKLAAIEEGRDKFRLLVEDFLGHCVIMSLEEIDATALDLLAHLGEHRSDRRQRLADWTRNAPDLIITGANGDMATLGPHGVRCSHSDPYMPWIELDRVEISPDRQAGLDAYRFVPKPDTPSHEFTVRMPAHMAESFVAEYSFWCAHAAREADSAELANA